MKYEMIIQCKSAHPETEGRNAMSLGALLLLLTIGTAPASASPATPPAHHCPDLLGAAHAPHVGASVARGDGGLALEVLSVHPPVWRVADFLSPAESEWYVGRAKRRMGADLVGGGMGASGIMSGDGEAAASGRRIEPYRDVWQVIEGHREAGTQEAAAAAVAAAAADGGGDGGDGDEEGVVYPRAFDGRLFHAAVRTVTDASLLSAAHSQQLLRALDADGDGRVAEAEWDDGGEAGGSAHWRAFHAIVGRWREKEPHIFNRFSQSGWEAARPPGSALAARVAAVLGIPAARLPATSDDTDSSSSSSSSSSYHLWGEYTQVLRYAPKGHYVSLVARPAAVPPTRHLVAASHPPVPPPLPRAGAPALPALPFPALAATLQTCHHDSSAEGAEEGGETKRAYTLLFHLRDVDAGGGETWFPGANRDPAGRWGQARWGQLEHNCTTAPACAEEVGPAGERLGLVVPARRGQAIIWQNHRAPGDPRSGPWGVGAATGLQPMDLSTLHAGCDVGEGGEKWVANQWVWQGAVERLCGIRAPAVADGEPGAVEEESEGDNGNEEAREGTDEEDEEDEATHIDADSRDSGRDRDDEL
jgi:hypothetical protein